MILIDLAAIIGKIVGMISVLFALTIDREAFN